MAGSLGTFKVAARRRARARAVAVLALLIVGLALVAGAPAATGGGWIAADLGRLEGDNSSQATAINASGQVVGDSSLVEGPWSTVTKRGFLWTAPGTMTAFGGLVDGAEVSPLAINDSGAIVGESWLPGTEPRAFLRTAAGVTTELPLLNGGTKTKADDINNDGVVVGGGDGSGIAQGNGHALLWAPGDPLPRDLGTLPGDNCSYAYAINNLGVVAGTSCYFVHDAYSYTYHSQAVIWAPPGYQPVALGPPLANCDFEAYGINDAGQVVGYREDSDRGFSWTEAGGLVEIGTLGGTYSDVEAVNEDGLIVGQSETADGAYHAFALATGAASMVDLTPDAFWSMAWSVNDAGQIVGWSRALAGDRAMAKLWSPNTTPPVVTTSGDVTVDATSPAGAPVTFTASADDDNDGDVPPVCKAGSTTVASGDVLPIGTTSVECSATDSSDNTGTGSFTVVVRGPAEVITDVRGIVAGLPPADKATNDKLAAALKQLNDSLAPKLWLDPTHPSIPDGNKVFDRLRDAVKQLKAIRNPEQAIGDSIARLVTEAEVLAQVAVADHQGGKADRLKKAAQELAAGDRELAAGHPDAAIDHYGNAWQQAVTA